jgi:hypothetical protein
MALVFHSFQPCAKCVVDAAQSRLWLCNQVFSPGDIFDAGRIRRGLRCKQSGFFFASLFTSTSRRALRRLRCAVAPSFATSITSGDVTRCVTRSSANGVAALLVVVVVVYFSSPRSRKTQLETRLSVFKVDFVHFSPAEGSVNSLFFLLFPRNTRI